VQLPMRVRPEFDRHRRESPSQLRNDAPRGGQIESRAPNVLLRHPPSRRLRGPGVREENGYQGTGNLAHR